MFTPCYRRCSVLALLAASIVTVIVTVTRVVATVTCAARTVCSGSVGASAMFTYCTLLLRRVARYFHFLRLD